ncbi:tannase/feruloyl esterase family alpha/beta hydrolase [Streptomyces sp. PmtG]
MIRHLASVTAALLLAALTPAATAAPPGGCPAERLRVPGAEKTVGACLRDLTTAGTIASGHTDPADWAGLEAPGTRSPSGVPGVQLDGYFPDSSRTNPTHGWDHDSQFVIRLPERWNGGLVVAGPPGVREQYANDRTIGDHVLARGYAFAATDKGNTGPALYRDGRRPGDAIAEWHRRLTQLTVAARLVAARHYGSAPRHTYAAGMSMGGYLVRWQLENVPWLYDGGLDWEGVLLTRESPNLLATLPPALRAYPRLVAGEPGARRAMAAAGYPPESAPLWDTHYRTQWDTFQRLIREEVDPGYDGATEAGTPFCREGTGRGCDTDYDYAARPRAVHDTMARLALTGRIGRPLVTVHGTLDALIPIGPGSDRYARLVDTSRRGAHHRYYRVVGGNHTDGLYGAQPRLVRPLLPCVRDAFDALTAWAEDGTAPPPSRTVPRPQGDPVHTCAL